MIYWHGRIARSRIAYAQVVRLTSCTGLHLTLLSLCS